jgi:hypothetical protein
MSFDAMPSKPPDLSEGTWLGATIAVGGLLCGIVSVAAIIWSSPIILLGIAAGAGWALSIVFAALYSSQRTSIRALETELAASRSQAAEWSASANNVATSFRAVLELVSSAPGAPRRRPRPKPD